MNEHPVPNILTIMTNVAGVLPSLYSVIGAIFVLAGLVTAFSGVLDLAQSSDKQKKYFGTHQASGFSGFIKIIIAGLLVTTAANANMIHIASSLFFDNTQIAMISLESYEPWQEANPIQVLYKVLLLGLAQTLGLLGIFKGLRIWAKASDKSGQDGFWHGFAYIIFGALLIQFMRVIGVIQATIGFDFFKMVGLV